jgi:hypothetical protein
MEQKNDNLRERLLSRLPQPENLGAFREETASLLAKHEKALFWEKMPSTLFEVSAAAVVMAYIFWGQKLNLTMTYIMSVWAFLFFVGATFDLRYRIYRSKVDMLKEVKQTQLQILELQASLRRSSDIQS